MASVQLLQRTLKFVLDLSKIINELPLTPCNKIYINQLTRCASSVGANFRASQRAKSPKDFVYKLKIVEEEADESIYFIELLKQLNPSFNDQLVQCQKEAEEILKIIVASIQTVRQRHKIF